MSSSKSGRMCVFVPGSIKPTLPTRRAPHAHRLSTSGLIGPLDGKFRRRACRNRVTSLSEEAGCRAWHLAGNNTRRRLSAHEFLELHARRLYRVRAKAALLVLFVIFEVAFEPF